MDYLKRFFEVLFPNPAYEVPAALLFLVIVFLAVSLLYPRLRGQRANLVLGMAISALLLMVMLVDVRNRWEWIVGLLPTVLVGYQAFFLWLYHPREVSAKEATPYWTEDQKGYREQGYLRALQSIESHFGLRTLFIRYGLPAVVLGITGIIILDILVEPKGHFSILARFQDQIPGDYEKIMLGIKLGAVGAYVYVLLELGQRTFRHDVTGASAMWCLVTLVLGPVLAGTVAALWRIGTPTDSGWWGGGVVLFFTGFAPRRVLAAIEQAAIQLLKIGSQNAVVESHLIPLSKVRGISPQIEERLGEEGIFDVNSLSQAEPVRLVRNTSFDLRQILSWIDEAVLIVTLPKSWEAFEEEGITGAIDLAWYYGQFGKLKDGALLTEIPEPIKKLASKGKIDDPASLVATIQRLFEDAQVQYIWALYNSFSEHAGGDDSTNSDTRHGSSSEPATRAGENPLS